MNTAIACITVGTLAVTGVLATLPGDSPLPRLDTSLANVSARAMAVPGRPVICGFIAEGDSMALIRAVGPGLDQFGVDGTMRNPRLSIFRGSERIWTNDDWDSSLSDAAAISSANSWVGAFHLELGSGDAATVVRFPSGHYTIHVDDEMFEGGEVLVEVYAIDVVLYPPAQPVFVDLAHSI